MKLYYARHKKTRDLLFFEGEVLVANNKSVFPFLMETINQKIRINGQYPFIADDYEIIEIKPEHTRTPIEGKVLAYAFLHNCDTDEATFKVLVDVVNETSKDRKTEGLYDKLFQEQDT